MSRGLSGAVASVILLAAASAFAHTRSVSYSSWSLRPDGADVVVRVSLLELSRLAFDPSLDVGSGGRAARYLADHLDLEMGGERCEPVEAPVALPSPEGWAHYRWQVGCAASGAVSIHSRVLFEVAPSHMHFARVTGAGIPATERVLTEGEPRWSLRDAAGETSDSAGTSLGGYIALGVEHIATGWDHLAFVLALLLLARRFGEVATLVTAFTVAHSVTLGLAVLGLVRPDGAAVEALIGYSIALVAAENSWLLGGRGRLVPLVVALGLVLLTGLAFAGIGTVSPATLLGLGLFSVCHFALLGRVERPARLRAAVAFAFGLVHGFGFAGVLSEMALPTNRLAPALFGFNVGVEVGQLAVVAIFWPLLRALARRGEQTWYRPVAEVGSAAICGLGLYWFVGRLFG